MLLFLLFTEAKCAQELNVKLPRESHAAKDQVPGSFSTLILKK